MPDNIYNGFLLVAAVFLALGFILQVYRIAVGPNSLDRMIGLDGFTASLQCALAVYICWTLDTTVTSAMLVVALLGFISSISVARFRKRDGA